MKALSTGSLSGALNQMGQNAEVRQRMIEFLREIEPLLAREGLNVREEITGPLVDALFVEGEMQLRSITSGLDFEFPYRSKIARDFLMAEQRTLDHVWEPQTTRLIVALGERAKNVIIGGAYFGDQALPLAKAMTPFGGVCHCFDVNREQLDTLARNATRNKLPNVVTNLCGLWNEDDRRLVLEGDDSHAYTREVGAGESGFPTIRIDSYVAAKKLESVGLIMLDIEGAELNALRGADRLLSGKAEEAPSVIFEVHSSYVDWTAGLAKTDIVKLLLDHGYVVFAVRDYQSNVDMAGRPIELVPIDDIHLAGPAHGFNMVAVKRFETLAAVGVRLTPGVSPKLLPHRDQRIHGPVG